jgi:zinc transporter ZupT
VHGCLGFLLVMIVLNLKSGEGSDALMMAAVWTAVVHLVLAIVGTFILKRFPTSFSVGFFLGLLLVIANQDLVLFVTFHNYPYGSAQTNHSFANLGLTLFLMLLFFALILSQFREAIVMAAVDVKGFGQGEETTVGSESYFGYEDEESEIASRGQGK